MKRPWASIIYKQRGTMQNDTDVKAKDIRLWNKYKDTGDVVYKQQLLKQFAPLIHSQVKKWDGVVPRGVLNNEAKLLASKAIDSYSPNKGAALSTHIANNLAPISRIIYTYQNTARLPENLTLKMQSFNGAQEHLVSSLGRDPTTDELKDELGWAASDINRIKNYNRKDLIESVGNVSGDFYNSDAMEQDSELAAIYYSLTPDEKPLFEDTTGYNTNIKLSTAQLLKKYNMSQAQLSYKKNLLTQKIDRIRDK